MNTTGPSCTLKHTLRLPTPGTTETARWGSGLWGRRIPHRILYVIAGYLVAVLVAYTLPRLLTDRLTDTGQAVVLTLLESASSELQKHSSLHTQGLSSSLDDVLSLNSSDNHTVETPPSPEKLIPSVHVIPDRENRSVDDQEDDHFVVRAEPKVLEVRYNVVDVEDIIPLPDLIRDATVVGEDLKEGETAAKEGGPTTDHPGGSRPATGEPTPTPDEIPSFSEWAQKQLEEAEKKVLNSSQTGGTIPPRLGGGSKLSSKNYASPDCGAKIVASNPEAESANSVLSPSRDEYVLNACVNRIWLVVELCEAIQAKKIDIANFELFSSSPKDFSVSVSDRFPSRDWRSVGQFTANDVRDVQSYDLHPQMFGKFVKVELHSHYGSEHYCPVSLIRVYGTSEIEVLETEEEPHHASHNIDEDEEGTLEAGDPSDPPRNLFGSAREVVMSIVKKATQALVKGGETGNATGNTTVETATVVTWETPGLAWVSTPGHLVVCDNCSDALFHSVWELLEQREKELYDFVHIPFVKDALKSGPICVRYGLDFGRRRPEKYPYQPDPGDYLRSLLPDRYVAALCNALAVIEKKVVRNASRDNNSTVVANITSYPTEPLPNTEYEGLLLPPVATCSVDTTVPSEPCDTPSVTDNAPRSGPSPLTNDLTSSVKVASQIKPTKTLSEAEINDGLFASTSLPEPPVPSDTVRLPDSPAPLESSFSSGENSTAADPSTPVDPGEASVEATHVIEQVEEPTDSTETYQVEEDTTLDTLLSELKELDPSLDSSSPPVTSSTAATLPPQKESVFVRISNRIKALEQNMSLSSQYLEELSRRYKRQVEEISRTLDRTLAEAETEAKRREELEKRGSEELGALRDEIATLTAAVNTLLVERDSWHNKAVVICQHVVLIAIEVLFFVAAVCFCRRLPVWEERTQEGERKWSLTWKKQNTEAVECIKRRKSMEEIPSQQSPKERRKRPSEVALNITGTYSDLLLAEPSPSSAQLVWAAPKAETKRRRRRKKEGGLPKSSSSVSLQQKSSRKTSTNSSSGGGSGPYNSGDVRRASLSELGGSIWIPVREMPDAWAGGPIEPFRDEEKMPVDPTRSLVDILASPSDRCATHSPRDLHAVESVTDVLPALQEINGMSKSPTCKNLPKFKSMSSVAAPAFMRTAASSRAERRSSEITALSKTGPDDWDFMYGDRQSSQTNSVPIPVNGNEKNGFEESSDRGSEAGGSQEGRKKTKGFKKMVKRFF